MKYWFFKIDSLVAAARVQVSPRLQGSQFPRQLSSPGAEGGTTYAGQEYTYDCNIHPVQSSRCCQKVALCRTFFHLEARFLPRKKLPAERRRQIGARRLAGRPAFSVIPRSDPVPAVGDGGISPVAAPRESQWFSRPKPQMPVPVHIVAARKIRAEMHAARLFACQGGG